MIDQHATRFNGMKNPHLTAALLLAIFAAGSLIVWWTAAQTDRDMRADLLQRTQIVTQAVNNERIRALTGTEEDLEKPAYLRLKEQLAAVRSAIPQCRFIYLTGRNADGALFFFVDSEPTGSKDYSPPGQVYDEAPEAFRSVFVTQKAATEGPYTDRFGTWVSALIPIYDRQAAIFGLTSPDDAWAMVRKALDFYRKNGRERFLKEIKNPQGEFCNGDLYAFVYDRNMTMLAHPVKPELIGQNLLDEKDWSGGKYFRREIQQVAQSKGSGWVDYEYENPVSKQRNPKATYVERADDLVICAGAYKRIGPVHTALGMDIDVRDWNWMLARAVLPPVLLTLSLAAILLAGSALLARRSRIAGPLPLWLRYLEPALTATVGLVLTLFAAWMIHEYQIRDRNRAFALLAAGHTFVVAETLRDMRDYKLEDLSHIYEGREQVTPEEFLQYTVHLTKDNVIQAWEWIPAIPAADKPRFEESARAAGLPGFEIWQKDAQGNRGPASGRTVYYPVFRIAPLTGNESALGYDLGSEPLRRAALEEAMHTGLITGTDPITLVQTTGSQKGMLIYRPIFGVGEPKRLRGFTLAVLQMNSLLGSAAPDNSTLIQISLLRKDAASELLAISWNADSPPTSGLSMTRFVFAFGKVFGVTVHAGQEFMRLYPVWMGGMVTIIGLTITAAITIVTSKSRRQNEELDQLVTKRTAELRESEQSYRNQFAHNSAVMLLIDPADGAIIDANSAATGFYGYPREQLLAMHITDINTLSASEVRQAMASLTQKQSKEFNFQHRLADGSVRDVEVSYSSIQFGGRIVLHSIIHDITQRRQAEEMLRQVADRLALATRAGGVGIWEYDVVNNKLAWDEQMYLIYGIPQDQFCGAYEAWQAVVYPEDLLRCDEEVKLALRGEKDFNTEFRVLWPDGTIRNIRALALIRRDASGQPLHMIGTNWDITAQKQAENDLRESEALQRQLLASLPTGVVIVDSVTRIIEQVNDYVVTLFGASVDHLVGQRCHSLLCPADEGACPVCDLGQAVDNSDRVMLRADGRRLFILKTVKRIHLKGQEKLLECFVDVSERKRVEAELQEANRYLEEATARANHMAAVAEMANASKSEFLANMSHEIRTPMNGVIGITGLLLDTELNDEQRRYAETVRASGESLLGLINDILDFSKIEAKKLDLEILDFDLSSLLDDFASTLAILAHAKGLELVYSTDLDVPTMLRGDPGRLRQILTNLAGNAVKFTPSGEVVVRVSLMEENENDVLLRLSVRDTGIGIPKDKIGQLFDKFSQVDASTTRQYGGTGLGLAISKQLAELMGGGAGVNSEEGKGSEFWFTARLGKQSGEAQLENIPPADLQNVRVLIVDDNATNCELLTIRLTSWGMRPTEANDGVTALHYLHKALKENDPFQIAVLDMQMPGMDGETLGRTIQADDRLDQTRMVMLTSLGMRGDAKRLEEIGFAAYATKPIRHQELKAVLSIALSNQDKPAHLPIATRHTAREMLNLFGSCKSRILLAEDNITNQMVALGILKKLGLRADVAANGAEALKSMESTPYDLVLMDVQMPGMDGIEATRKIRNSNRQIPIIAMTAHAMQDDRERCMEAGMNDYVTKPMSPYALAEALDKWLPKNNDKCGMMNDEKAMTDDNSPSSFPSHSSLIFDRAGMMARLMGDEDLARMVAEGFLKDIPLQIAALKGYLESGDAAGAERQAHTIKGASANVGGEDLRAVAFEMEKAAMSGDLSAVAGHMVELELQFNLLNQAITEEL